MFVDVLVAGFFAWFRSLGPHHQSPPTNTSTFMVYESTDLSTTLIHDLLIKKAIEIADRNCDLIFFVYRNL